MHRVRIWLLLAVVSSGLFAGLMAAFVIAVQRMLVQLDAATYVVVMQGLIRAADQPPLVPMLVIVGVLTPLGALWELRRRRGSWPFRLVLLGFLIFAVGALGVTLVFNVPINTDILTWSPDAPPADWEQSRDRWNALSWIRFPAATVSMILHATALSLSPSTARPRLEEVGAR